MADIFEIAGRIHSTSQEHVTSPADEILDTSQNKKQHLINADVARHESEINSPTNGLNKRVEDIEALGQIGDTPVETNASNIINNTSLNGKVPSASAVNGVYNAVAANAGYYACDSEASTTAKVVEASGYVLTVGGCIKIKMTNANTADEDATLNINSTGAKALYYAGERASATNSWEEGETVEVYYDGTSYYANNVAGGSGSGDGAFDVSAKYPTSGIEGGNTYTLEGALAVLDANLSASKKKGGMSIKFIQSSDHKYVNYRLTKDEWSIDTEDWAIAEEGVYVDNPEFVYVKTDKEGKILWAIKNDGGIYYGVGVPQQVIDYIEEKIADLSLDEYEDIVAFLNGLEEGDKTLQILLSEKVDKEEGKSLIDAEFAEGVSHIENPEFVRVYTDSENKILWAIKANGDIYFGAGVPQQIIDYIQQEISELSLDEYEDIVAFLSDYLGSDITLKVMIDGINAQIESLDDTKVDKEEGKSLINEEYASTKSNIENPEFLEVTTDSEDKVLEGIQPDGTKVIGRDLTVGGSASISGDIKVLGNMEVSKVSYKVIENPEYLVAWVDTEGKVIFGLKADGKTYVGDADFLNEIKNNQEAIGEIKSYLANFYNLDIDALTSITAVENPEYIDVVTDSENKILAGRTPDGAAFENVGFSTPKMSIDGATIENIEDPESRTEILTDSEGKIVSYRDSDGVKHENVGIETDRITIDEVLINGGNATLDSATIDSLNLTSEGMTEFQQALKDSGFKPGGVGDWTEYLSNDGDDPLCIPQPKGIALVNILSDVNLVNLSKSTTVGAVEGVTYDVPCQVEFYDMDGNYFKKWVLMSGQGNSSMAYPKKNIALDFFDSEVDGDAFKVKFGDWVPQDSWHLKAYYTDAFRCIGLGAYKLYDEIVKTRGVMADYVYKKALIDFSKIGYVANGYNDLKDLSLQYETGAKCFPDGFPVIVYQNGVFFGLYCWQIKKHRDNYHMKKSNKKHIHLDGTLNSTTFFNGNISWTDFEVRNPKDLIDMDGEKYNGDIPKELIDSSSQYYDANNTKHVNTAAVKQYIINFSNVMSVLDDAEDTYNASSKTAEDLATLKGVFETYFDIDNLVDYLILSDITRNYDGFSKNWQWLTYDGVKWWVGLYDCDGCFGNNFTGSSNILPLGGKHIYISFMYHYLLTYYVTELEERYSELRQSKVIDADNIIKIVNGIMLKFGEQNIENEFSKWTNCPCNRDVVLNENWEFDLDEDGNPQFGTANYNNATTYNTGDSCYYALHPNNGEAAYKYKAKDTVTGIKPVDSFGYRDSIYRLYNWIKKSIENMDIVYSYNN